MNMDHSEGLLNSTIRIEAIYDNGTSTGSGFFMNLDLDFEGKPIEVSVIVTNRHVIRKCKCDKLILQKRKRRWYTKLR